MTAEEIEKLAAMMKGANITVQGDFVPYKHVDYEIGKVEPGGIGVQIVNGGTPKTSENKTAGKSPKTEMKMVKSTFTYRWIADQETRIMQLYQYLLLGVKWIDKNTDSDDFSNLFRGEDCDCKVKWIGKQSQLYYLIKVLLDKDYIRKPKSVGQWVIVQSHFVDKDSRIFTDFNSQKKPAKTADTIEQMAEILNPAKQIDSREFVATLEKMGSLMFDEDDED